MNATITDNTTADDERDMRAPMLPILRIGHMLGDDPRLPYPGEHAKRLTASARIGELLTVENPRYVEHDGYRVERQSHDLLNVERVALRAWLDAEGTAEDRASRAAAWANAEEVAQ